MTVLATFAPSESVRRVETGSLRSAQPASGAGLVSLAMGEPGFDTPPAIRLAAHAAIECGYTHYAHPSGDPELREAIAAQLTGIGPTGFGADGVLVTHGGTGALAAAILAIVNPGDKVVLPDPTYSLYADLVHLAGGRCVHVPLQADLHWDLSELADALAGAKLFVFCNPSNPTGIVHRREELEALAEMTARTGTIVVSDEAYSELVYADEPFTTALAVSDLADRTVYCQTFSKAYAMTGWRLGYLAGPAEIISAAVRVHSTIAGPLNSATQRAALTALVHGSDAAAEMRDEYRIRRDLMVEGLQGIDSLSLAVPDGAFYAFPRYNVPLPAVDVVAHLRTHGLAVRPGSEFGPAGEHHLRLSFAADCDSITTGIERLRSGLAELTDVEETSA